VLGVVLAVIVCLILGLTLFRWLLEVLDVALTLAEALIGLSVLAGGGVFAWKVQRRRDAAEAALVEVFARDRFWDPDAFRQHVGRLFEPYWRSVAAQNAAAVAEHLSDYWRSSMEQAFDAWRQERCKPVLFELRFIAVNIVGLEDWQDNRRDQITALVDCRTSYHLNEVLKAEVVEGVPVERDERQLWRFVRGARGWLLNRVEIADGSDAFDSCRVVVESRGRSS
jgi:hypothetical protein